MALKKSVNTDFGMTAPEAYHRIKSVDGRNDGGVIYYVDVFYNKAAKESGAQPMYTEKRIVPSELRSQVSVVHELYELLKKEPDYDGYATDVFEDGFFPYFYTGISGGFILKTTVNNDSYNDLSRTISGGILEGKILTNGQVVLGTFRDVQAEKVQLNGNGDVIHGYVNYANADGYVVQVLLGD